MTDETEKPAMSYAEIGSAPIVYFDGTACHGVLNGTLQLELVARILVPTADGGVDLKLIPAVRLRCCPAAAKALLYSIESALQMAERPEPQPPVAASKLN
jgi:hypothetical protein